MFQARLRVGGWVFFVCAHSGPFAPDLDPFGSSGNQRSQFGEMWIGFGIMFAIFRHLLIIVALLLTSTCAIVNTACICFAMFSRFVVSFL